MKDGEGDSSSREDEGEVKKVARGLEELNMSARYKNIEPAWCRAYR